MTAGLVVVTAEIEIVVVTVQNVFVIVQSETDVVC